MQKKVLHLIASLDPAKGGVASAVRTLIKGLREKNIHNEVVCFDSPDAPYTKNQEFIIIALHQGTTAWQYNKNLSGWLSQNLHRFDTVILHGLWLYNSYALTKAFKKLKNANAGHENSRMPEYYIMPHGMLDPYFQLSTSRKIKAIRNWLYWKVIEKHSVHRADGLLFTCEEEKQLANKSFTPYGPKKEIVIGLGIEAPPAYQPEMRENFLEKCAVSNNRFLLFLGRIHEKKGVDLLLYAYHDQYKKALKPVKLVIAGPDKESVYGKKIMKIIEENKFLSDNVILPGMLEGNAKWGSFYGCEAFVLPSHQENFGISIIEAMACGIPVLISNKVNIWREISDSDCGFISDDDEAGTNLLLKKWLATENEVREHMKTNALKGYETHFSIGSTIEKIINKVIYSSPIRS